MLRWRPWGRSSIFPVCAGGHGQGDPDWQSSPNPPGGRTRLIGSEQIWRRSETKDKEVRARALTLLMSRGGALATCQSDVQDGDACSSKQADRDAVLNYCVVNVCFCGFT